MRRQFLACAAVMLIGRASLIAQNGAVETYPSGLDLLKQVTARYAEAKSYEIESVEERTSTNELTREWQKTILTAALAPAGRFHYEGHSGFGSAMKVTDGNTVWTYHAVEHRYTAQPSSASQQTKDDPSEFAISGAKNLRTQLAALTKGLKSADRFPDATIKINGIKVHCYVIHFQNSDEKRASPGYSFEKTVWVDKTHLALVKISEHAHTHIMSGASRIPLEEQIDTFFTKAELNGPVNDRLFTFVPPPDAKLVQEFPDPAMDDARKKLTNSQAPPLKLKSADGRAVTLDSFRGKPVLLDVWATWCGPCVDALPRLAQIEKEARDKGLVVITIDKDEDADTAIRFLASKGYTWSNFHDEDGEIETVIGSSAIPRTMLIDSKGEIIYDELGMDEDALRTEIMKLGPEYATLAPKPKPDPCMAPK